MEYVSYADLVENIRFYISENRRGYKQAAVAELGGYGEKEFSNMLNGRKKIQAQDIPRIAVAVNTTPNDLLCKRHSPSERAS